MGQGPEKETRIQMFSAAGKNEEREQYGSKIAE
jgi:hypothetical protein